MLADAPHTEATWFIDPPYVDGGANYVHKHVDYDELGAWCASRRGQVIVCERTGANWLPFRGRCYEAIWTNEEPEQRGLFE